MGSRPEVLFPLFASCLSLKGVGQKTFLNLQRMKISRPRDIMLSLPVSGIIRRISKSVFDTPLPAIMTVEIQIIAHIPAKTRGRPHYILVRGSGSDFNLVFFHSREDYLKTIFPEGEMRVVSGKVEVFDGLPQMTHPDYVVKLSEKKDIPEFEAVYPLTYGVTQKFFSKLVKEVLRMTPELDEWIDPNQKLQAGWPDWKSSILTVHNPLGLDDFSSSNTARERLSYDEFFAHQLTLALARMVAKKKKGMSTCGGEHERSTLIKSLSYKLTNAQSRVISEILKDMAKPKKMIRLLQGDVGSGKTIVAFFSLITAVSSNGQAVLMAPTEILARQHYEVFLGLAKAVGVKVDILTGRDGGRGRKTKLEALANGSIQILVGTHAVFQQDVVFLNLRLVVVDEQHRFGVNQRLELSSKGFSVDVLVMTATPIPRSLALANFGDMEISILDEKPIGRKAIKTVMISTSRVKEIVKKLDQVIKDGRQIYWVCPLVEESELSDKVAVVQRFENLGTELGRDLVGVIHGQMSTNDKDVAMQKFVRGETKVLVATTVIEVGVDVPNATIMVIERAELFGLSQLHQLRGRVGRGRAESTCVLMYKGPLSKTAKERLSILRETEDGFKISEMDLKMRGTGDLIGTAQSGLPEFWIGDMESQGDLMEIAHSDARALISVDPHLKSKRGLAARNLLWFMDKHKAIDLIKVG